MSDLPRYKCHKEVSAFKIARITGDHTKLPAEYCLESDAVNPFIIQVSGEFIARHLPQIGGYYVVYADGYASYSPTEAFEQGYSLITDSNEG